jgi:hypothetical protein
MLCDCHGELMHWNRDSRYHAGGFWRCAIKRRAEVKARHARDPEKGRAKGRRHYHERGGYEKKRLRELAAQRASALDALAELHREEARLAVA